MKRLLLTAVLASVLISAFSAPALAVGDGDDLGSMVVYDLNMNGQRDRALGEDGIDGWWIDLCRWNGVGWDMVGYDISDTFDGYPFYRGCYMFWDLAPSTYMVRQAEAEGCWVRTGKLSHIRTVATPGNLVFCNQPFYNVCLRCVDGRTMGFWSNKNGLKALKEKYGNDLSALVVYPDPYPAMSISEIQAMARLANAKNMCDMLKAQYVAHWLNVNVLGADYSGAAIVIDHVVYDYDEDVMQAFATFVNDGGCANDRAKAGWWKNLFDGLNNDSGSYPVVEYQDNACPAPWAGEPDPTNL